MNSLLKSLTLPYRTRCTRVKHALFLFYVKQNGDGWMEVGMEGGGTFQSKVTGRESTTGPV